MKTAQEIIESGILEEYVLGMLSDTENQEVENYMRQYPEIQQEVFDIQESLYQYSLQYQKTPRPELKNEILAQIESSDISLPTQESSKNTSFMAYAAILLGIIFSVTFAVLWQNEVKNCKKLQLQLQNIEKKHTVCQNTCKELKKAHDELIINDKNCHIIAKLKEDKANTCIATVYWSHVTKQAYYEIEHFPKLPENKVCRLWCISNKTPIDAGVLKNTEQGLKPVQPVCDNVEAFAVTIEDKAGEHRTTPPRPEEIFIYTPVIKK
jgi:anti-sigma-K factor RskA